MNLLFRVVYATHANGTHHKLALDALRHLRCMDADLWQRMFLANASLYLEGSKAPDNDFKDFKNHVLHTRDGFWGGAPAKVQSWYGHLVEALALNDWPTSAYCAGVLSHYYTDPLQPFHTAQSEAENNIHRAAEWSISRSYDELRDLGERDFADLDVALGTGPNWLVEAVCKGAEIANGYYEKLIAHYDIQRGVVDPPSGLDRVAKRIVAEMIRYAYLTYGMVLDRAIQDSNTHAPDIGLTLPTLLATIQIPAKVLVRRIADAEERRTVERIYDELVATGTVERNLPEDDRTVRELHAAEVLARRAPQPAASKVFPFKPRERVLTRIETERAARGPIRTSAEVIPLRAEPPAPVAALAPAVTSTPPAPADTPAPAPAVAVSAPAEVIPLRVAASAPPAPVQTPAPAAAVAASPPAAVAEVVPLEEPEQEEVAVAPGGGGRRFYLTLDHDVVDGPSIGAKTADRLRPHGISKVRDLLRADPVALAVLVDARHITAEVISAWQDQAMLVCSVPGLRGTHAQLLVGAGYRSADAIAEVEADKLCADVLAFAASAPGQRLLRNGDPPDIEKIRNWLEAARSVRAA
jgi:hypothetical protein